MAIYQRDSFLAELSAQLGRAKPTQVTPPTLPYDVHHQVLQDASSDELTEQLKAYSQNALGARFELVTQADFSHRLMQVCCDYVGQSNQETVLSADPRLTALIEHSDFEKANLALYQFDETTPETENLRHVEAAKVGVVYCEQALAESGTMVLYSTSKQSRMLSLLPEVTVFVVAKSTLVARITQAMEPLSQQATDGQRIASCVNLISGPSSTADIELTKVVGVHGPTEACYIVLDDL
ncbi:LutC/YkgG family protein [Celerinatantimonas diazotrophica]|uniref:L-lactate dehydrogenase complex protein LldG n=1 Tax=Celerinatantimonas diazotrophica TaxID=412034 RepID=A0A4R1J7P2_9GAMM|nr:lactate utilization protein C [Celerinatantimonas diazotrophica]TCK46417.1 L-lactate dehydrogenase complex protein LldG [Celerinatantimonas diazotrophica]CAG9295206.1 Lactate utilization protein C [Celerinatantimonas diazotrophica]